MALADFDHPGSGHALLWDLKHAGQAMRYVPHTKTPEHLRLVNWALSRFETKVEPVLARLRSQVIHNDLNPHNILVLDDDDGEVVGIIDFGDMVHSALVNDVAVSCSYLIKEGAEPLAAVSDFLAAYCEVLPLLDVEYEILPELIATRLALTVVIANWRVTRHPDNSDYILRNCKSAVEGLNILSGLDPEQLRHTLRSAGTRRREMSEAMGMINAFDPSTASTLDAAEKKILARRQRVLGPAYRLFYRHPLHLVRGEGVWLTDNRGRKYLDAYNNVACVGHCHPHVVAAAIASAGDAQHAHPLHRRRDSRLRRTPDREVP